MREYCNSDCGSWYYFCHVARLYFDVIWQRKNVLQYINLSSSESKERREEKRHVQTRQAWASRPAAPVYGGERGSWDNHFLSWQSGRLSAALAHGSWLTGLQHTIMPCSCLSLGFTTPEGSGGGKARTGVWFEGGSTERKAGGAEEGKEKEEEEYRRRGESERMWLEPWGLAKSPSLSSASSSPFYPTPPWLPVSTQWLLLCWNFTLLDPRPGVLFSHNVQAAEHAAGETHSAS